MKVFWAFIALLALAAAVLAFRPTGGPSAPARSAPVLPEAAAPRSEPAQSEPVQPASPVASTAQPQPASPEPEPAPPVVAPPPATAAAAPGEQHPELPDVLEQLVTSTMAPTSPAPGEAAKPEPLPEPAAEPAPEAPAAPAATATTPADSPAAPLADAPAPGSAPAATAPLPATTIVRQADGSQLIDNRFLLRGEGTKEKPYEVTWDMLVAAQEVYKPRLGQKTLPGYLDIIDGAYVKIAGYIAFPLMAQSPDEMLMMLNQWDGCCIGIPPTPYDAIEVRLRDAAEGETRFKVSGSLVGKLAVDPYLVKDWLIGLYTMDDAVLTTEH